MAEEKWREDNEFMKDHEENKEGANISLAFANHTHETIVPHMKAIQSLKHLNCEEYLQIHMSRLFAPTWKQHTSHWTTLLLDKMEKREARRSI